MTLPTLSPNLRDEAHRLQKRLEEIEAYLARMQKERDETRHRLEQVRSALTICPKCGRDHDFLTDDGGVLVHVLEDAQDVELLSSGKPLFCPKCGEVFLYRGGAPMAKATAAAPAKASRAR